MRPAGARTEREDRRAGGARQALLSLCSACVCASLCAACNSGSVNPCCDASVDLGPSIFDSTVDAPADARPFDGPADTQTAEGSPPGEGTPPAPDGGADGDSGPPDPCTSWSNWTCSTQDTTFLCKGSCSAGAAPQALSCLPNGDCICGVGLGPCGNFGGPASGCDACRKAVEADCCKLKGP